MKKTFRVLSAIACLLGFAAGSEAGNILVNGSFETPALASGTWTTADSMPGWTSANGAKLEWGWASVYGVTGQTGNQVMELDSYSNVEVYQETLTPGAYVLSFLYARRADVAANSDTDKFEVRWNGNLVASFDPGSTAMTLYSTTVFAAAPPIRLTFLGTGPSNSYGAIIDDVQLNSVPDGGATAMLLGVAMAGLGCFRRRTS